MVAGAGSRSSSAPSTGHRVSSKTAKIVRVSLWPSRMHMGELWFQWIQPKGVPEMWKWVRLHRVLQVLQVPSFTPWCTIIPCGSDMIRCKKIQKDMWYGRYGWIFFCRGSRIEANIDTLNFYRKVLHVLSGWHICLKHVMHREWIDWILSSTRLAMQSPSSNWGVTSPMVDSTAQWKWTPISNGISMN
jgi:hypothetical protein